MPNSCSVDIVHINLQVDYELCCPSMIFIKYILTIQSVHIAAVEHQNSIIIIICYSIIIIICYT